MYRRGKRERGEAFSEDFMSDHCNSPKEKLVALGVRPAAAHWRSPETRSAPPVARGEFPGGLPTPTPTPMPTTTSNSANSVNSASSSPSSPSSGEGETRRDFLATMGFGLTAATLAACRAPEHRAIPLPVAAEDLIPGVANHYATTCGGCAAACALVVKQRDGRPIKIEGNDESELFGGATCATGQATVLSLYDHERLRGPLWQGEPTTWRQLDDKVAAALDDARASGGGIALLSTTLHGPSTLALIDRWKQAMPAFRHVVYEPVSASGLRTASRVAFGRALLPHYTFDRANVIVSLDADFLGTWISPVEFARQYGRRRSPDRDAHLHVQFEAGMSVTGSNADRRVAVRPSQLASIAAALLARVARLAGHELPADARASEVAAGVDGRVLDEVAGELWKHRGLSLVVSGGNDLAVDRAVLAINALLGNVGCTLHVDRPSQQRQGDDEAVAELVAAMERGDPARGESALRPP
jgi:molybdopterin-containing oxidoreductase family iron-sulfur binding subunit